MCACDGLDNGSGPPPQREALEALRAFDSVFSWPVFVAIRLPPEVSHQDMVPAVCLIRSVKSCSGAHAALRN
jgi:hypothetical protein